MNREIGDAAAAYQIGDWPTAKRLCGQILEKDPGNADALHLLGLIAAQSGEKENAVVAHEIHYLNPGNRGT